MSAADYVATYHRLLARMEKLHTKTAKISGVIDIYELTERIPDAFFIDNPYFTFVAINKATELIRIITHYKNTNKVGVDMANHAIDLLKRVKIKKLTPILKMPGMKEKLKAARKNMNQSAAEKIHGAPVADICTYVSDKRPCHLVRKLNDFQYTFNIDGHDETYYIYSPDTLKEYIAFLVNQATDDPRYAIEDPRGLGPMMVCSMIANLNKTAKKELFNNLSAELTGQFKNAKEFMDYIDDDFWMADPGPTEYMHNIINDMGHNNFINFMYANSTPKGKSNMPFEMHRSRMKSLQNIRWADAGGNN